MERYPRILAPGTSATTAANGDLLAKFDIVDQKVGFRPSRVGGVRVEVEHGHTGDGCPVLIAHNYGHGGAGKILNFSWTGHSFYPTHAARTPLRRLSSRAFLLFPLSLSLCLCRLGFQSSWGSAQDLLQMIEKARMETPEGQHAFAKL